MKVLGISFGRKGKVSEILLKEALFKAKEAGADVKFISTVNMNIGRCTGCGACTRAKLAGKELRCYVNDDFQQIQQEIIAADGIILAAPVYSCGPTGQLKNVIDRNGAPMDKCGLENEKARREKAGQPPLAEILFKQRYVGYISVGGANTQNWVSMGLPTMSLFGFSGLMKNCGMMDAYGTGGWGSPVLEPEKLAEAGAIGTAMVEAYNNPDKPAPFAGKEGACPVCHLNFINIKPAHDGSTDGTNCECPICGTYGTLTVEDGKIKVVFSEKEQARARSTMAGLKEHQDEIAGNLAVFMEKTSEKKEYIEEALKPYLEFENTY